MFDQLHEHSNLVQEIVEETMATEKDENKLIKMLEATAKIHHHINCAMMDMMLFEVNHLKPSTLGTA